MLLEPVPVLHLVQDQGVPGAPPSNYLPITGMTLPGDKDVILRLIDKALMDTSAGMLRAEWMRGL